MTDNSNNITEWQRHVDRLEKLAAKRKDILDLDGKQALDAILDHPQPTALVHSFAEEDLMLLINDIGPEDALDLIEMASDRQWEFILDIESWEKDRLNLNAITQWMGLMLKADPQRFVHWAVAEKSNLIEYFLNHSIELVIREHDQDPSDFGDGFITYDDIYYFRIPDEKYTPETEAGFKELHQELLTRLMDILANTDHVFYQQTLLRSACVIPAESEEEAFRLRNSRLAEKGFLPFHEAVGVFQPMTVDQLEKRKKVIREVSEADTYIPIPMNHASMLDGDNLFARILAGITDMNILQQLRIEFAGVCNQLASTGERPVRSRDELKTVVGKAGAYISIGLEMLLDSNELPKSSVHAEYITTYPLIDLFRTGYGGIARLRQQAKHWQQNGWFAKNKLALSFWGERFVGIIGGMLINRPKFYDARQTDSHYREFATLADIETTAAFLNQAMAYDHLFSSMNIHADAFTTDRLVTFDNMLLTLWARQRIGLSPELSPIPITRFRPFFAELWDGEKTPPEIKEPKKTDLLHWLAAESKLPENEISRDLGDALEHLFAQITEEYGHISADQLGSRFIHNFLLTSA